MSIVTFSFLGYLQGPELLALAKRFAKQRKKADSAEQSLSWHQDRIAVTLGFNNWSLLHKHLDRNPGWSEMDRIKQLALNRPGLGDCIKEHAYRTIDEDHARVVMKQWARAKYTPLIEFAFYDNESESGFSWPDVNMAEELSEEFAGRYPDDLIEEVGNSLDADEGPWGLEDYGD